VYVFTGRLLLALADARGRLTFAYKDLLELACPTRLYVLLSTLQNLKPFPLHAEGMILELSHINVAIPQNGHSDASGFLGDVDSLLESEERGSSRPLVKDLSFVLREDEHLIAMAWENRQWRGF
jgi:ATP-binding cassette subfamily D (ALD) long-chain fatty acid import protein